MKAVLIVFDAGECDAGTRQKTYHVTDSRAV